MFLHVSVASEVNVLRRRVRCFTFYNRGLIGTAIARVPVLSCIMFSEANSYYQDDRPHINRNVLALDFVPLC